MTQQRKAFVTGASGFVGGHIAHYLAQHGMEVVAFHHSLPLAPEVVSSVSGVQKIDLSIEDVRLAKLVAEMQPDVIIHAAALASANACELDPNAAHRANAVATRNVVRACALCGAAQPLLLHISTDLVFDGSAAPSGGFAERTEPRPLSVYAQTKVAAEQLVLTETVRGLVLRTSLVYGAPVGEKSGCLGWLVDGLREGKTVTLFDDEFRTPVYVGDVAKNILQLAENSEAHSLRTLHFAGPERVDRYDFGCKVAQSLGLDESNLVACKQANVSSVAPRCADASLSTTESEQEYGVRFRTIAEALPEITVQLSR